MALFPHFVLLLLYVVSNPPSSSTTGQPQTKPQSAPTGKFLYYKNKLQQQQQSYETQKALYLLRNRIRIAHMQQVCLRFRKQWQCHTQPTKQRLQVFRNLQLQRWKLRNHP